ncbi:CAP domain-containing protein [Streptomyces sp. 24-1644]|uniref:CAP domain-containing protein n=1 Tax=Streptomyces sp. 24-1644 TaxID=3457315 RepID=UPI003FA68B5F
MGRHGKKRASIPVRTGLLGVSAAMAVGAVAVTSGLLPGGDSFDIRGSSSAADQIRSGGAPDLLTQGGTTASPTDRASASTGTSRSSERPAAPSTSASSKSAEPSKPAATPSKSAKESKQPTRQPTKAPAKKTGTKTSTAPATKTPAAPKTSSAAPAPKPSAPDTDASESARAAVLSLVNQERAKVGCSPVAASRGLTSLAQNFSEDMAARGFFAHTDPDGTTPWDRAAKAGVLGLGGENIARGQAGAQAVMDGWMNSDGHRANILNCDYKTLGVGVHFGSGGPWWTQDFGF